jgi:phosphoglycerate dehydrogenase-like enzyme
MQHKLVYLLSKPLDEFKELFKDRKEQIEILRAGIRNEKTHKETLDMIKDATIIIFGPPSTYLTKELLEAAHEVQFIQCATVGYDRIDLDAATELGIPVANNRGWNTEAVGEHTIMLILMCLRKAIHVHHRTLKKGWTIPDIRGFYIRNLEFNGKTLGILGYGSTGTEVARLARAFGPKILYHKRTRLTVDEEFEMGVEYRSLNGLLSESDIVSVHVPLTDETKGMIGSDELSVMKDGAILVNVARSGIVDEGAVAEALNRGKLSAAGFDVVNMTFEDGVWAPDSPLTDCENIVITPHTAGPTKEAMVRMEAQWTENIFRFLDGEKPLYLLNDA